MHNKTKLIIDIKYRDKYTKTIKTLIKIITFITIKIEYILIVGIVGLSVAMEAARTALRCQRHHDVTGGRRLCEDGCGRGRVTHLTALRGQRYGAKRESEWERVSLKHRNSHIWLVVEERC